jgi:hypothetical protein
MIHSITFSMLSSITPNITRRFTVSEEKVRENRIRRAAERQGLRLVKSRRRDPRAIDYGRYWLVLAEGVQTADLSDDRRNLVAGPRTGYSIDEIEALLEGRADG